MRAILGWLGWLSVLVVLAAISLRLTSQFGFVLGLLIYVVLSVLMSLIAGWLLTRSEVGKFTWKNQVAGVLLPWSRWLGSESLRSLLAKNAIASASFGCLIAISSNPWFRNPWRDSVENGWSSALVTGFTIICWIVLVGAWLRLLQNKGARNSAPLLFLPPLAVVTSMVMRYSGMEWLALIVVAIPLLLALLPVALMLTGLLFGYLTGKPIRWN